MSAMSMSAMGKSSPIRTSVRMHRHAMFGIRARSMAISGRLPDQPVPQAETSSAAEETNQAAAAADRR